MTKKIRLEMTTEQAYCVQYALEILFRLGMGQISGVKEFLLQFGPEFNKASLHPLLEVVGDELCRGLTGDRNCYLGIHSDKVPLISRRAYDTFIVLRNGLSLSNPSTNTGVLPDISLDPPSLRQCLTEILPKFSVVP
jgi:hypothetical protein